MDLKVSSVAYCFIIVASGHHILVERTIRENIDTAMEGEDAIREGSVSKERVTKEDEEGKIWIRVIRSFLESHKNNRISGEGTGKVGGKIGVNEINEQGRREQDDAFIIEVRDGDEIRMIGKGIRTSDAFTLHPL